MFDALKLFGRGKTRPDPTQPPPGVDAAQGYVYDTLDGKAPYVEPHEARPDGWDERVYGPIYRGRSNRKGREGDRDCKSGIHFPAWYVRGDVPQGFGGAEHFTLGCGRCGSKLRRVPHDVSQSAPRDPRIEPGFEGWLDTPRGEAYAADLKARLHS